MQVKGLDYSIYKAYEMAAIIVMLGMNIALANSPEFSSGKFEKALPPQYTFEILTDIISSKYLNKDTKV